MFINIWPKNAPVNKQLEKFGGERQAGNNYLLWCLSTRRSILMATDTFWMRTV